MSKAPRIGLWKNDRGPYASGNCGGIRFVLWENRDKQGKQPDFHLVMEAPERRDDQAPQQSAPPAQDAMPEDTIPFGPEWRG